MAEREQITVEDVQQEPFPDPNEPKGRHAGLSLLLIIGSVFLVMIIVMVVAFVYFNNSPDRGGALLPLVAALGQAAA